MANELAEKFIAALNDLETTGATEKIVALFDDASETGNITLTETLKGKAGAEEFWTNYRKSFSEISSTFRNKIVSENTVALEWNSTGKSVENGDINYEGVSILETDGEKITRFFAYFNPAKLGEQIVDEKSKSKEA